MSYAFPEKLDKQVFALLPASLEERLKRYCLREHRSQSQAIRIMIERALEIATKNEAAAEAAKVQKSSPEEE